MGFEFVIPMNRKDLRSKAGVNQYVVDEVLPIRLMSVKLQECRQKYHKNGATSILECFDTFYSLLVNFAEIDNRQKEDAWDLLIKGMRQETNQLNEILDSDRLSQERETHLNTVKMQTYLLCQMMEEFEMISSKPVLATGKSRRKAKPRDEEMGNIHWEAERDKGIRAMLPMFQLSLHRLWDPPVIEEEFVNMVTNICYKMLENPDVCKDRSSRDTIFSFLAVMNKKYNHERGCGVKIIQLLQNYEHLAPHLACAVELFVKDHGSRGIVFDIMREIGRINPADLARDTSGTKAYAQFLVELAEKIPETMLSYVCVIIGLLDEESYTMRNSILGVLGEMVIKVLRSKDADQKMKQTRDQFLDHIEDHIHDVHAFVRSKCLQIWQHLLNEEAVPLPRLLNLLNLTIGRVMDKSSQVRRYAVQNLTLMLRLNPFAAKLSLEELKENYFAEKKLLEEMLSKVPETAPPSLISEELEEEWNGFARELMKAARSVLEEEAGEKEDQAEEEEQEEEQKEEVTDEDSVDTVKQRLIELLRSQSYIKAVRLWLAGQESFIDHPLFTALTPEQRESEEEGVEKKRLAGLLQCMRCIFTGEEVMPEAAQPSNEQNIVVNEVTKKQVLVQYLEDSMNFTMAIEQAVPVVCQLLGSKNMSDVSEAINFFVTGFEFGVSNAIVGVRRMLVLVWSKEAAIKEAVVSAYRRLYLNPDGARNNSRARCAAIINNLTALSVGANMGDLTSLEELICEFVLTKDINESVVQMMWERFTLKIPNTTSTDSRTALVLLGMAARADVDLVRSNIDVLVSEGLGPRAEEDFHLARDTCTVLLKLAGQKQARGAVAGEPFRLAKDHEMFTRLAHLITTGALEKAGWIPFGEQAINVIYKLSEQPDELCSTILKRIVSSVYDQSSQEAAPQPAPATQESDDGYSSQPVNIQDLHCPAVLLTRLLSIAGHIALRQLVHLDVSIYGELKRRQNLQEKLDEDKRSPPKKRKSTASATPGVNRSKNKTKDDEDLTAEEEMGLTGASAEDRESEFIRKVTETELLSEGNLLSVFCPIIVHVCSNRTRYSDSDLQSAASLALAKFMLISPSFCEQHLQLLFSILEKSPNPTIRANTIIALGDLTFRFPNTIEPWTPNLYARLRDESPRVRKNTTMVLTHLVLNDMVKVKGNISELASCIVDHSEEIADLAKLFFHELAKKGNAIYNIMPDVVSRLSDPEVGVEEENFRTIMKYLFSFIQKDRQCESLVEKLCHRFRATRVERQWRDLAFCLSMLTYSDKSIRKLQENFPCFADKLSDEDVYNSFMTILRGAPKLPLLEELEQRIEEAHSKGVEEDEVAYKASKFAAKVKGKKTPSKTPGRRGRARKASHRSQRSSQDSDNEEQGGDDEVSPRTQKGRKAKPRLTFSSDEGEDEEIGGKRLAVADPDDPQVQPAGGDVPGDAEDGGSAKKSSDTENADPNVTAQESPLIKKKSHKLSANSQRLAAASPAPRRGRRHPVKAAD